MNKRVWEAIFKMKPPMCPSCRVPIIVHKVKEYDEKYLVIIGQELSTPKKRKRNYLFVYSIKKGEVICGSRSPNEEKEEVSTAIKYYEETGTPAG